MILLQKVVILNPWIFIYFNFILSSFFFQNLLAGELKVSRDGYLHNEGASLHNITIKLVNPWNQL